jgi:hypothetical protein
MPSHKLDGTVAMPESNRILILTSCTGLKIAGAGRVPAERLYLGEQHRRLMRGVDRFRAAVAEPEIDLRIVSAGLGLVRGDSLTTVYDESFSGLGRPAIAERAASLGIPGDVALTLQEPFSLAVLLLGDDYMTAAAIDEGSQIEGPVIAFGGTGLKRRLGAHPNVSVISATKIEAQRFHCGLVGLKGELCGRLLEVFIDRRELLPSVASWSSAATLDALDECRPNLAVAA